MTAVEFRVYGTPKPQGSKRHVGNGIMVESGGQALRTWREDVKQAALAAMQLDGIEAPLAGPIELRIMFWLARPSSHFRTGRKTSHLLTTRAPDFPWRRPDIDKLLRSTLDAITSAGLWHDDACAVHVVASKSYCINGSPPGADVRLETLGATHS